MQPWPRQMYLLCYDTGKGRLEAASVLVRGPLLRAAAIADLVHRGLLRDRDGRAARTSAGTPDDPFLAAVLDSVPADRPRRWFGVVDDHWWTAEHAVRDALAADGTATLARRRRLGLFPTTDVAVSDPGEVHALRARVRGAVLGEHDPAAVPIEDALLATLAADGHVALAFGLREQHRHRATFSVLAERVDAAFPGLRAATQWSVAARRASSAS
ncbi:GOLPH3/VPS74 family protein [Actinomycetospora sp. C-140]